MTCKMNETNNKFMNHIVPVVDAVSVDFVIMVVVVRAGSDVDVEVISGVVVITGVVEFSGIMINNRYVKATKWNLL